MLVDNIDLYDSDLLPSLVYSIRGLGKHFINKRRRLNKKVFCEWKNIFEIWLVKTRIAYVTHIVIV